MNETRFRAAESRAWARHGARPTERRVRIRSHDLAIRVQELGDGPPVVFLHGALTSGLSWVSLAARLDGFRRIVVDRPGTGLSDPLPDALDAAALPRFADTFVGEVLDALGLESAHVAANSLGAYVALRSAAAHPERVDRMVLYSWSVGVATGSTPWFVRLLSVPGTDRLLASIRPTERTLRLVLRMIGGGPTLDGGALDGQLPAYVALFRDTDTIRNELAHARTVVSLRNGLDRLVLPDALLETIRTPTYLLWGEDDLFGGPDSARRLAATMPNARLELIPGAGHTPWLDDLDHCVMATTAFLDGEPSGASETAVRPSPLIRSA